MLYFLFLIILAALFGIYFINIGLAKTQLEELTHRLKQDEMTYRDLEEWEFNMARLFGKPFGTKNTILYYGKYYEEYVKTSYPDHESDTLEKYRMFKEKHRD